MDRFSEVKAALVKAANVASRPVVFLSALLVGGAFEIIGSLVAIRLAGQAMLSSRMPPDVGGLAVIGIAAAIAVPAIVSGLWAVARAAVINGKARWNDFWGGLGTYYWRLVGLSLLLGLFATVVFTVSGVSRTDFSFGEIPLSVPLPLTLAYLVGRFFAAPVLPAMVVEQEKAISAVGRGVSFAWANAALMAPAVGIDLALGWVFQKVNRAVVPDPMTSPGPYAGGGMLVAYVALVAVGALVGCYFRVLYLELYRMRRPATPASPADSAEPQDPVVPPV